MKIQPKENIVLSAWKNDKRREPKICFILRKFCENSSILGVRFFVDPRLTWIGKSFWVVSLIFALGTFSVMVIPTWIRWRTSTIIMQHSVTDLPFPAITICSDMKFDIEKVNISNLLKKHGNTTRENADMANRLSLMCPAFRTNDINWKMSGNKALISAEKYAIRMDEFVESVYLFWNEKMDLSFFKPILTDEGVCYTFNAIPGKNIFRRNTFHRKRNYLHFSFHDGVSLQWSPEEGYKKDVNGSAYPYRMAAIGRHSALVLNMKNLSVDEENLCSFDDLGNGYLITVHNPADVPLPSQRGVRVPRGTVADVVITPEIVWTDSEVRRSFAPSERQCYFADERRLRFFKSYTQSNCKTECLANFTLRICKCVGYFMPREPGTKICFAAEDNICMEFSQWQMNTMEANIKAGPERMFQNYIPILSRKERKTLRCNCLQNCNDIDYSIKVAHVPLLTNRYMKSLPRISFYYEKLRYFSTKRSGYFDTIEFIATCGGLLGLCLGFNLNILIEVIYWLLVHPGVKKKISLSSKVFPMNSHLLLHVKR